IEHQRGVAARVEGVEHVGEAVDHAGRTGQHAGGGGGEITGHSVAGAAAEGAYGQRSGAVAVVVGQAATCGADHADVEGAGGACVTVHAHVVGVAHGQPALGQGLIAVGEY